MWPADHVRQTQVVEAKQSQWNCSDVDNPNCRPNDMLNGNALESWTNFVGLVNMETPPGVPDVHAQSDAFLNAYRSEQTITSTITTWFVANGVCLAIILFFTQNITLSLFVMVTICFIFLCLLGLLFAVFTIPFGYVEAIGVSIFIGLSANYSLHVVHAYHRSPYSDRKHKIQHAVFITGGPIASSAISTIGGCAFLLACRTWLFVELGIMICCSTTMALLFSMCFLLGLLTLVGPLPYELEEDMERNGNNGLQAAYDGGHLLHQCDIKALFCTPPSRLKVQINNTTDDNESNSY